MSDFKAKMHQIRFPLGLRPRPRWGSLQRSPDPLAVFKRPILSEGRGKKGGRGREGGGKGKGKGGEGCTPIGESGSASGLNQTHVVAQINKLRGFDGVVIGLSGNHWAQFWPSVVDMTKNVLYRVDQYSMQTLPHVTRFLFGILDTPTTSVGETLITRKSNSTRDVEYCMTPPVR